MSRQSRACGSLVWRGPLPQLPHFGRPAAPLSPAALQAQLEAGQIRAALEGSLRRLQTDRVELYQARSSFLLSFIFVTHAMGVWVVGAVPGAQGRGSRLLAAAERARCTQD